MYQISQLRSFPPTHSLYGETRGDHKAEENHDQPPSSIQRSREYERTWPNKPAMGNMGPSEKSALFGLTEPFEPLRLSGDGRKSMVETSPMPSFMRQPCTYAHPIVKKPVQPSHLQIPSFNGGDTFPPVHSKTSIAHIYLLRNLFSIH